MRFRTDLEGLRGVAVALVVLYHFDLLGATGGFVGVDAFFVLSGFLITSILNAELVATGGIDLRAFYLRRARRILPASLVALVLGLAASALVVAPLDLPQVASDATACGLFACNITFALRATDYFAVATPSPFLHFWSLGVEEQFYLAWPLFLVFAFRRHRPVLLTAALVSISIACALALSVAVPPWAFFALPSRAWQLGAGAMLALTAPSIDRSGALLTRTIGVLGIGLLGYCAFAIDRTAPYPGLTALAPTAAVLMIVVGGREVGIASRALRLAPLRWLGRISFSLYLYHWPVFVLATTAFGELGMPARSCLVVLAVLIAQASRSFVERPFLDGVPSLGARRAAAALAIATIAVVLVTAQYMNVSVASSLEQPAIEAPSATAPFVVDAPVMSAPPVAADEAHSPSPIASPAPPREVRPRLSDARTDTDRINERGCGLSLAGDTPPACVLGDVHGEVTVALVGDSHAAQWAPALEEIARARGWRLIPYTKDSCIFLEMRIVSIHLEREYTECARWRAKVVAAVRALRPDLVVVSSSRWVHPVDPIDADPVRQANAMAALLGQLDAPVALIADTPLMDQDVPACLSRHSGSCDTATAYALTRHLARDGRAAELAGATLIDPTRWLCGDDVCGAIVDRTIAYGDDHHLTATMARSFAGLLEPVLLAALR